MEKLQHESFDLVLLDVEMPEMNGIQSARTSQGRSGPARHPGDYKLSRGGNRERLAKRIELGAQGYLPKPFNLVLLHARLTACLEHKQLRQPSRPIPFKENPAKKLDNEA